MENGIVLNFSYLFVLDSARTDCVCFVNSSGLVLNLEGFQNKGVRNLVFILEINPERMKWL